MAGGATSDFVGQVVCSAMDTFFGLLLLLCGLTG